MVAYEINKSCNIGYFTYLKDAFKPFPELIDKYNWVLSDCELNTDINLINDRKDCILKSDDLKSIFNKNEEIQFIWGVLSSINKNENYKIGNDIIKSELVDIFEKPKIQRKGSIVEFLFWDSSCFIFLTKDKKLAERFLGSYPSAKILFA